MRRTVGILSAFAVAVLAAATPRVVQAQDTTTKQDICAQRPRGSQPYRDAVRRWCNHETPKIVGGKRAPDGFFPWEVSLNTVGVRDVNQAHFCGGVIYTARWIVTAAHCLDDNTRPDYFDITVGTNRLDSAKVRVRPAHVYINPRFDVFSKENDIALVQLTTDLTLSPKVQPIALATSDHEASYIRQGQLLEVAGWGYQNDGGKVVSSLRYARVPVVDRESCNRPTAYDSAVKESMLCAGERLGSTSDVCNGDSGGPLSLRTASGSQLIGIVSWSESCGQPNKVGVYSRVSSFVAWIQACVAKPEDCTNPH